MHKYRLRAGISGVNRRGDGRMDAVCDEELLLLFDERSAGPGKARELARDCPSVAGGTGAAGELAEDEAVLTLGEKPVVVSVRPEPRVSPLAFDEHLPGFEPSNAGGWDPARWPGTPGGVGTSAGVLGFSSPMGRATESLESQVAYGQVFEEAMAGHLACAGERRRAQAEVLDWLCASDPSAGTDAAAAGADNVPSARRGSVVALARVGRATRGGSVPGRAGSTGRASPPGSPFSWRRMAASAVVSGGLGSVTLLALRWLVG